MCCVSFSKTPRLASGAPIFRSFFFPPFLPRRAERSSPEGNHSRPFCDEVKKILFYASSPPCTFMACTRTLQLLHVYTLSQRTIRLQDLLAYFVWGSKFSRGSRLRLCFCALWHWVTGHQDCLEIGSSI